VSRIDLYGFLGVGIGLFVGMIGHEYAHARAAVALGDPTPRFMGRLTLNPKAHVDPIGTVILPGIFLLSVLFRAGIGFMFGWAKPVTISPSRLRNPRRDAMLVALAGPGFNLAVAAVAALGFRAVSPGNFDLLQVIFSIVVVNSFLFVINILPIPPLDGSKVLARFLSPSAAQKMEELSQYFLLFIIVLFLLFRGVISNMAAAVYEPLLGI
jgi:Zn-dependent protease